MDNRTFFNSIADKWDEIAQHDPEKINVILDFVQIKPNSNILDVGTGTGIMIPYYNERILGNGSIVAVDIAENMIELAKQKNKDTNVKFLTGDILKINLPIKQFDYIFCYSMFPHFEDKEKAISVLAGYLALNGKLIICHSQSRDEINELHKSPCQVAESSYLPTAPKIQDYFKKALLTPIQTVDNAEIFVLIAQKL
ncbi:class I SAM-dependent methyltransferase [Paludicola sp. MB14-C6]|uniref:class I SAM-dependent methyltransferase n=1 Tax=Paludihabitans sp. MB14-C6 TaxID=3070656 RepID=UPI0027DC9ED2|nr:class I SAM-dependent methyltransferase [Paludicola sp. MB14-C6]WMJ23381.1 class I SAM-dependent methyltransferase [Paludicola sp. MB14-C6]